MLRGALESMSAPDRVARPLKSNTVNLYPANGRQRGIGFQAATGSEVQIIHVRK
jgi:hypothetical protein